MPLRTNKPLFMLAPMDDVTDSVFRRIVASTAAPDVFYTEFVNVDGLQSPGRKNLLKKLQFIAEEQPLIAQIWGKTPENYYKTARELADGTFARELGVPSLAYEAIDINMVISQITWQPSTLLVSKRWTLSLILPTHRLSYVRCCLDRHL